MQWLQDPNKSNVDNLNSVRRETSRHFRNKKNMRSIYIYVIRSLRVNDLTLILLMWRKW
jgi:hypothetical protein